MDEDDLTKHDDFAWGDRVAVSDKEPVHVLDAVIVRGGRATVVGVGNNEGRLNHYITVEFDGVAHEHSVPAYRFRKLDPVEALAELDATRKKGDAEGGAS